MRSSHSFACRTPSGNLGRAEPPTNLPRLYWSTQFCIRFSSPFITLDLRMYETGIRASSINDDSTTAHTFTSRQATCTGSNTTRRSLTDTQALVHLTCRKSLDYSIKSKKVSTRVLVPQISTASPEYPLSLERHVLMQEPRSVL